MLMVAPSGTAKLVTSSEAPIRSSTHSIVTGSVAEELELEKASNCAGAIARKKRPYRTFVKILSTSGYSPSMRTSRATTTVPL